MEHVIEGKKFCITGKLEHYTRTTAQRAIMNAGGEIAKSVGPKTDFLVVGRRAGSKLTKAKSLGIPVIEEADLESFLAGDVVEVDEEVVVFGDSSVRDLIGEARAALDGRPSSKMWDDVLEIVDACVPTQLEALVDFLEPQIARWDLTPKQRWTPKRGSHGVEDAPPEWLEATPFGELRVAPHQWLVEMITKHDSPKYRLIHAIHMTAMRISGAAAAAVLEREDLVNLRRLDVTGSKLSATFWKKLRALPSTQNLEVLHFDTLNDKSIKGIPGNHHLQELREISFQDSQYYRQDEILKQLLSSDLAQGVRVLTIKGNSSSELVKALADETIMPNLEELGVKSYSDEHTRQMLGSVAAIRVGRLNIETNIWFYHTDATFDLVGGIRDKLDAWTKGIQVGPAHVDLSRIAIEDSYEGNGFKEYKAALNDALGDWKLPPATTHLHMGKWYSADLKATLDARGVTVIR